MRYAGHSWELYAMWAWIGPFLVHYFANIGVDRAVNVGNLIGSVVVMTGGIATYLGGKLSDTFGRLKMINFFITSDHLFSHHWLVRQSAVLAVVAHCFCLRICHNCGFTDL